MKSLDSSFLRQLAEKLPQVVQSSKSKNTIKSYQFAFRKFSNWCKEHALCPLPASVSTIAVYMSFLIQQEVSSSILQTAYYSIKWEHEVNLCNSVFAENLLHLVFEGGVRILSKPVRKKEPITVDILKKVVDKFNAENCLPNLRICALLLIGYAGFLRFNELANIKASNLIFFNSHVEILIESSKTDIYRQGNKVFIARTNSSLCPVLMLERYLEAAKIRLDSDDFIFRSIRFLKSKNIHVLCKLNKPLSYTRARELMLDALSQVGIERRNFGLHSLRSGGVTQAAKNKIPERLLKVHGRWKSDLSKDGYIKDDLVNRLSVTENLNL